MTDRQLLEECLELLEAWFDGEMIHEETREMIQILTDRFTRKGKPKNEELTVKYEKAKELRQTTNMMLKDCLKIAGITPDQWYRRKRIEEKGRDRDKNYYDLIL